MKKKKKKETQKPRGESRRSLKTGLVSNLITKRGRVTRERGKEWKWWQRRTKGETLETGKREEKKIKKRVRSWRGASNSRMTRKLYHRQEEDEGEKEGKRRGRQAAIH